jgi:hypothetical protein
MKNKTIIYLMFFVAFSFSVEAQNLVPNYSFEDTIQCPTQGNQVNGYVADWTAGGLGGQSYFDSICNVSGSAVGVPLNTWGYQYPHTGVAYTGIYTFFPPPPPSRPYHYNERDYLQVKLIDTLIKGSKYFVAFFVSLADSSKEACNNMGAYFSDSSLVYNGSVKPYLTPQVANDTSHQLTDKINWMKISGSFTAQGGEAYMVIGNFTDDKHCDSVFVNSPSSYKNYNWNLAYYYIDDVIVTTDSNYADSLFPSSIVSVSKPKEEVRIFPNPSNGKFEVNILNIGENSIMDVYNIFGEIIYSKAITDNAQINLSSEPIGIYFYRISTEWGNLMQSGKLIISN